MEAKKLKNLESLLVGLSELNFRTSTEIKIDVCLKDVKEAIAVNQQRELLPDFLYKDKDRIFIGYHGDTEVSQEWNEYLKKLSTKHKK